MTDIPPALDVLATLLVLVVVVVVGSVALCGLELTVTGTPSGACSALF